MGAVGAALYCLSLLDELHPSKLAARPRDSPNDDAVRWMSESSRRSLIRAGAPGLAMPGCDTRRR